MVKGVSYATVVREQIDKILDHTYKGKLMEIPCYNFDRLQSIVEACRATGTEYALHYPSYDSYNRLGYDIKGDKSVYLYEDIIKYIEYGYDAKYVLMHFPDSNHYDEELEKKLIYKSFDLFKSYVESYKDRVVIENLTSNKFFCRGKDYKELLSGSGIGLCLDIGHAHLVDSKNVYEFIEEAAESIKVIHYYNTCNNAENKEHYGKHYSEAQGYGDDWIDLSRVDKLIDELPNVNYLIDESRY